MRNPFSIDAKVRRTVEAVESARRHRPLGLRFLLKGVTLASLLAGGVVLLASRYSIAIATQEALCLTPYRVWLIDKGDITPLRGGTFAFKAKGLQPVFPDGTNIVKVMVGLPGDDVSVTEATTVINGEVVGEGLAVATERSLDTARYVRHGHIEIERYWFMGRTADSFDSRYWGSVARSQLWGRAYPIW